MGEVLLETFGGGFLAIAFAGAYWVSWFHPEIFRLRLTAPLVWAAVGATLATFGGMTAFALGWRSAVSAIKATGVTTALPDEPSTFPAVVLFMAFAGFCLLIAGAIYIGAVSPHQSDERADKQDHGTQPKKK